MVVNKAQRVVLAIAASLLIVLLALHNPTKGYETEFVSLSKFLGQAEVHAIEYSVMDWMSKGAFTSYLITVGNTMLAMAVVVVIAAVWLWLLKTNNSEK